MSAEPETTHRAGGRRRGPLLVLVAFFVGSRGLAWALGLRFDTSPIDNFWQLIDVELLRTDLLRSLFYLHAQPPLFNLFVGVFVRGPLVALLPWTYLAMTLGLQFALYGLLTRLGVAVWPAVAVACWFVARPGTLLVESWLMYDLPVTCLLAASAWALAVRCDDEASGVDRSWPRHLSAWLLGVLVLSRALFHALFLIAAGLLAAWRRNSGDAGGPRLRLDRRWLVALAGPLVLVSALYLKNAWLYGQLGTSSWLGMNWARVVQAGLDDEQIAELAARGEAEGKGHGILAVEPFGRLEDYEGLVPVMPPPRFADVPLLTEPEKTTGARNFHHVGWIAVSDRYVAACGDAVAASPGAWPVGAAKGVFYLLQPLGEMPHLSRRIDREQTPGLAAYVDFGRALSMPWQVRLAGKPRHVFWTFYVLVPAGLASAAWLTCTWWLRGDPRWRAAAFLLGASLYVFAVGCAFEVGENARFRAYVDPLWVAALAAAVSEIQSRRMASLRMSP